MGGFGGINSISSVGTMGLLRNLSNSRAGINRSMERLATGKQINRAADDPSAIHTLTELQGREKGLLQSIEGAKRADSRYNALDGAHSALGEIVLEVKSRVLQASNTGGMSREETDALQIEIDSLLDAYDFSAQSFTFEGVQMLSGVNVRNIKLVKPSADGESDETFSLADFRSGGKLSLRNGDTFTKNADTVQGLLDEATQSSALTRGTIGIAAKENAARIESMHRELDDLRGYKSQIEDTDYGKETAELARNQILNDAQTFLLSVTTTQHKELITNLLGSIKK